MRNRKRSHPGSLSDAFEMCIEFASEHRKPIKVLADKMGVELKTLYRWLSENSMPMNRVHQFEVFCGVSYISDYLCLSHGDKMVVSIPSGKKAGVSDIATAQANSAKAISLLAQFYKDGSELDETVSALTTTLTEFAFHRQNVLKADQPELSLFEESSHG